MQMNPYLGPRVSREFRENSHLCISGLLQGRIVNRSCARRLRLMQADLPRRSGSAVHRYKKELTGDCLLYFSVGPGIRGELREPAFGHWQR